MRIQPFSIIVVLFTLLVGYTFFQQFKSESYSISSEGSPSPTPHPSLNIHKPNILKHTVDNLRSHVSNLPHSVIQKKEAEQEHHIPKQARMSQDNLQNNWDLTEIDPHSENITSTFTHHQPMNVVYHDVDSSKHISPKRYAEGNAQSNKSMYLGSSGLIKNVQAEREQAAAEAQTPYKIEGRSNRPDTKAESERFPVNAFEVAAFYPGTRHNGDVLVPVNSDLYSSIQGPNYSFEDYDYENPELVKEHLSHILPLGHGGTLILKIKDPGILINKKGFDITIYQTTFQVIGTNLYFQKFARLGVSNSLHESNVRWFPCDPDQKIHMGCIGVVPTKYGGDKFDLSFIGVQTAKYIWIRDTNRNESSEGKWPTEGCQIDAVHFHHIYQQSE